MVQVALVISPNVTSFHGNSGWQRTEIHESPRSCVMIIVYIISENHRKTLHNIGMSKSSTKTIQNVYPHIENIDGDEF